MSKFAEWVARELQQGGWRARARPQRQRWRVSQRALNESPEYPEHVREIYRARRDALCDGLARIGWEVPRPEATMFAWAPIPAAYRELDSLEFALKLTREARVAVSPGGGFGPGGEGHVRFALVENEQRIRQAVRGIRRALGSLA